MTRQQKVSAVAILLGVGVVVGVYWRRQSAELDRLRIEKSRRDLAEAEAQMEWSGAPR